MRADNWINYLCIVHQNSGFFYNCVNKVLLFCFVYQFLLVLFPLKFTTVLLLIQMCQYLYHIYKGDMCETNIHNNGNTDDNKSKEKNIAIN